MIKVTDNFYVSSQISEEHINYFKEQGFNLVICNRPNGEESGQTDFELIEASCKQAEIDFVNLPMIPGSLSTELITETLPASFLPKSSNIKCSDNSFLSLRRSFS